jgi:hypothetical protein
MAESAKVKAPWPAQMGRLALLASVRVAVAERHPLLMIGVDIM